MESNCTKKLSHSACGLGVAQPRTQLWGHGAGVGGRPRFRCGKWTAGLGSGPAPDPPGGRTPVLRSCVPGRPGRRPTPGGRREWAPQSAADHRTPFEPAPHRLRTKPVQDRPQTRCLLRSPRESASWPLLGHPRGRPPAPLPCPPAGVVSEVVAALGWGLRAVKPCWSGSAGGPGGPWGGLQGTPARPLSSDPRSGRVCGCRPLHPGPTPVPREGKGWDRWLTPVSRGPDLGGSPPPGVCLRVSKERLPKTGRWGGKLQV